MRTVLDELGKTSLPHDQALEVLSAKALAAREYLAAYLLADRRCRIDPPALSHCYVLRAEASFNLGDTIAARSDLLEALQIVPHDLSALRRLFAWGTLAERENAAKSLITCEPDLRLLRSAVTLLFENGERRQANLSVFDQVIRGWVAWDTEDGVELRIASGDHLLTSAIAADPFHALTTDEIKAASFTLARPKSSSPQTVSLSIDGNAFLSRRIAPNHMAVNAPKSPRAHTPQIGAALPTVVIPVYDDFAATKACLDSVLADPGCGIQFRLIIIDDASPDQQIAEHLQAMSVLPFVELLINDVNLGFVGSVNRALATIFDGDVLLLNADTLVPPGFVGRLFQIAQSAKDIGTVVPLSNNSGISDFPVPNQANPIGSYEEVVELDRIAQCANHGLVVDLPNGTGFCLYITRTCLSAVGHLAETYQRGYLEDVDFCLRARELGFRSVCAPGIYVGHAGSRSFGETKRALVLTNLAVIDFRFPNFRAETSSFVKADPLLQARNNIERLRPAVAASDRSEPLRTSPAESDREFNERDCLAVIPTRASVEEFSLIRGLAVALLARKPEIAIVVAGSTFDDDRLMSHPNVFVSGSVAPLELDRLLMTAGTGHIVTLGLDTSEKFAPAFAWARSIGLPVASVGRSEGLAHIGCFDLVLAEDTPQARMIETICDWVTGV
jgi:O-antigen biosynthesis protein